MDEKQMQFSIDDGQTFYSDEISIMNNQYKFFLDFKNSSPRVDVRSAEALPVAIKHNTIIMDPALAKLFSKLMAEHVKKFEEENGTIAEIQIPPDKQPKAVSSTDDKPGYFG